MRSGDSYLRNLLADCFRVRRHFENNRQGVRDGHNSRRLLGQAASANQTAATDRQRLVFLDKNGVTTEMTRRYGRAPRESA